ncbi:hypothetical protein V2J09_021428 [Rumex salicifolius]
MRRRSSSSGSSALVLALLVVAAAAWSAQPVNSESGEFLEAECLNVPASTFANALRSTMSDVGELLSMVSKFSGMFQDLRLSNAINDCVDLLDLSSDELSWTLSSSQTGKSTKTKNIGMDMKTWLSAALVNQETCLDGFDGTSSFVKNIVSGTIGEVTSLVQQALNMVHVTPNSGHRPRKLTSEADHTFPSWIGPGVRRLLQEGAPAPDAVVALDGTGNFTKIMDAVDAAPSHSETRFTIYIEKGVYSENVEIKRKKTNIVMYGDGMDVTVITGNRNVADGWTTYRSATFAVTGAGFIARDMTFENTAGPEKHQAVAFRSDSDLSAVFRCAFRGYQDTLYTHANRQFYRECTVTGTVDFIFGDAVAVLQNCKILARKGLPNQKNTVTAQGRKDPGEITGFSLQQCNFSADSDLLAAIAANTTTGATYLGRPWKQYSRTVVMESYMSDVVRKEGWLEWNGDLFLDTLYYAEYMNSGPGSGLSSRVKWPGYHVLNSSDEAANYTVTRLLEGDMWLPQTGVRFTAGLSS